MIKTMLAAAALSLVGHSAAAAPCITSEGQFAAYKQALAQEAAAAGVGQRGLQALQGAQLSPRTWRNEADPHSQTSFQYRDPAEFLASRSGGSADAFIAGATRRLNANANLFNSIERSYGVPGSILVTIWGLETAYGGYTGRLPVIDGHITMASHCRRHPQFEDDAIAMLQLVDRGIVSNGTRGGDIGGELGHMQFLAGTWARYAVDGSGDGRADPYNPTDAMASAANMLRANGWQPGQPFTEGTRNFQVLSAWNDSGNYQRAIAYAAARVGG